MVDRTKYSAAIFRRGLKKELFDDGDETMPEDLELEMKLKELLKIWKLPRTGKELSAAIWRPQHRAAEVVLQKGRLFSHLGFTWGKRLFLHIEEIVYMMDRANLLLFVDLPGGKKIVSLHEAYEIMLGAGVSMDMYVIYCKMMRAGYIIQRHPSMWTLKSTESPTQIWAPPEPSLVTQQTLAAPRAAPAAAAEAPPPAKRQRVQKDVETKPAATHATATATAKWWPDEGHWWKQAGEGAAGAAAALFEGLPRCEVEEEDKGRAPPAFNMQPLATLMPTDLADIGTIEAGKKMLHFDVYPANSHFSRKASGRPSFVCSVCPAGMPPPVAMMNAADQASNGIPVRYATVEHGDIGFYAAARTVLPNIFQRQ